MKNSIIAKQCIAAIVCAIAMAPACKPAQSGPPLLTFVGGNEELYCFGGAISLTLQIDDPHWLGPAQPKLQLMSGDSRYPRPAWPSRQALSSPKATVQNVFNVPPAVEHRPDFDDRIALAVDDAPRRDDELAKTQAVISSELRQGMSK